MQRFSDRVADYTRFRPRYPKAALPLLAANIGFSPQWIVADIGSGTGISSELFLENGNTVFAVEPNDEMRHAAEKTLAKYPKFRSINGTAENTNLAAVSVDMVVAAQAFHWFKPEQTSAEFARILKPRGWIVLMWNRRQTRASAFLRDYEALLNTFGTDYSRVRHDKIDVDRLAEFFTGGVERHSLPNEQIFDYAGLEGRLRSCSYVPAEGHADFAPMLAALKRLFDAHNEGGQVRFEYQTEIYRQGWDGVPKSA